MSNPDAYFYGEYNTDCIGTICPCKTVILLNKRSNVYAQCAKYYKRSNSANGFCNTHTPPNKAAFDNKGAFDKAYGNVTTIKQYSEIP